MNVEERQQVQPLKELLLKHSEVGSLWKPEGEGIRCVACGHRCLIFEGRDGVCKVRSNVGGQLKVPWGYVAGLQLDPIEKKPFFHVRPGARALSFGMLGCDFHCGYCQNWFTSQSLRDPKASARPEFVTAEGLIEAAVREKAEVITSTYNEPLITSEWAVEIFKQAKAKGLKTSYVSNGNGTPEVLEFIRPWVDYYKVDLKGFDDKRYRQLGGVLERVTDSIQRIYEMGFWLELVTLVIPRFNDSSDELKRMTEFIASVSPLIPWHATAYHEDYKMRVGGPTPEEKLLEAAEIGRAAGLKYIYLGNVPGKVGDWENTYCHGCGTELIKRTGYRILKNEMQGAHCFKCQTLIPGRWE